MNVGNEPEAVLDIRDIMVRDRLDASFEGWDDYWECIVESLGEMLDEYFMGTVLTALDHGADFHELRKIVHAYDKIKNDLKL